MKTFILTFFITVCFFAFKSNAQVKNNPPSHLFVMLVDKDTIDLSWGIFTPTLTQETKCSIFVHNEAAIRKDTTKPVELVIDLLSPTAMIHHLKTNAEEFNKMNFIKLLMEHRGAERVMIELKNVRQDVVGKKIVTVRLRTN